MFHQGSYLLGTLERVTKIVSGFENCSSFDFTLYCGQLVDFQYGLQLIFRMLMGFNLNKCNVHILIHSIISSTDYSCS